jgi:catechol 2,3-dioxygenase-like lactoylglutathione lyase family enzyme
MHDRGLDHELLMTSIVGKAFLLFLFSTSLNMAGQNSQLSSSESPQELPKTSMHLKVDHAGICSYQLEPMQQAFAGIGLQAQYGGAHATGGTHNALLGFDDGSYIELIAAQHPETMTGEDAEQWTSLKPDLARACFWAVDVDDIGNSVKQLREAGLKISDPKDGSRKKPDGTVLQWQTAVVNEGANGNILPFFIQDKTPRSARIQPSASVKGSELRGIEIVVIGVKSLKESIELYRRAFNLPEPAPGENSELGAKTAYFSGTPVILAQPLEKNSWLTAYLAKFGEGPIGFLLRTSDFARSKQRFALSGETAWYGRKLAWIDGLKLHGARLGVIE